ncbi:D-cysteine desulfhydrase family protein [Candidatus Thorarchaeota archaeon]|nr:MAG: D-cysteine desulfhydrase family protein [Candidatus Thorarchaeota archaeon]
MFDKYPRERFAYLPTPLHRLKNLGNSIGLEELWIKRDDLTGPSIGGNKTRKLEFVVGDAKANKADTLVTIGGIQSNHCRQTAVACATTGLRCILLLAGAEPETYTGNLLLDSMLGAEIKFYPDDNLMTLPTRMDEVIETLKDFGLNPYAVPAGASIPIGSIAYGVAMQELQTQSKEIGFTPEKIIVANGTGGTMAGLIVGAHMLDMDVDIIGVSVLYDAETSKEKIRNIINRMIDEVPEIDDFNPKIHIDDRFLEDGYGIMTEGIRTSIDMFAKMDGIFLDPVYTGKTGLALMRMALNGDITAETPTVFWHTGGYPALFAYPELGRI